MVEEMRRKGDNDGADVWLRIMVAIGELGSRSPNVQGAPLSPARERGIEVKWLTALTIGKPHVATE